MSRRVVIKGGVDCRLANLAEEVVQEMQSEGVRGLHYDAKEGNFLYEGYDDHYKQGLIQQAESRYGLKLQAYQTMQIKKQAQKDGLEVEETITETGEIDLVLTLRVYE